MTRRDTIIITTLVNAGLLACLFVTATRQEELKPDFASNSTEIAQVSTEYQEETVSYISDDVDQALKEFMPLETAVSIVSDDVIEPIKPVDPEPIGPEPIPAPPNPLPKPITTSDSKIVEVKVKKGDFLERIAKANGTTVSAIKEINGLRSDKLIIGQTLKIPVGSKPTVEKPKEVVKLDLSGNKPVYYTVQSGDNPWKIAKKFHVRFEDILLLNNMNEEKSKTLKVGQEIRVK